MPDATLTSKGQVTIPKPVRDHLKVDAGDRLSFTVQPDGSVVIRPIVRHVRELAGVLHRPGRPAVTVDAMRRAVAARMRRRAGRSRP